MESEVRIGVDVGGTFTDTIALDPKTGRIISYNKTETIPTSPSKSVTNSLRKLDLSKRVKLTIIHATTLATNIIRGQKHLRLPKIALITTKGFKDVIEIGRQKRPKLYDLKFSKPKPLVPRELRFEVNERVTYEGKVIKPIEEKEVLEIGRELKRLGVESLAISLLHSYANPVHEKIIEDTIKKLIPELHISASYKVDPEHREYERTSTTVVNALLKPLIKNYLESLQKELESTGDTKLLMIQSNGGLASVREVIELPISIIESGPTAGLMATNFIGKLLGEKNLLGFDMGGTTAKAGSIIDNKPLITTEYEVGGEAHMGRIIKGSGYPVRFPFVELSEVSAGGGTVIWVDEAGSMKVGPVSAGAYPGPACYNKGGEEPTITDAHIILGRLNPEMFLGGEMHIEPELSLYAFKQKITKEIGLEPDEASIGAIKIINSIMSRGIKITSVERGIDPRDLTLVAYGGAGPLHACELAEELGFRKVIVPPHPGLFSAFGLLTVDAKYSAVKSIRKDIDELDPTDLTNKLDEVERELVHKLEETGLKFMEVYSVKMLDMRYWGQGYELTINIPKDSMNLEVMKELFHEAHEKKYGYMLRGERIEVVNLRVDVIGVIEKPQLSKIKNTSKKEPSPNGSRTIYHQNIDGYEETKVYHRTKLLANHVIHGPAVIEEYDSTTIIPPKWVAKIGSYGEIIIQREGDLLG